MRIADGYILKEIAGNHVVIPVGQNIVDYKSILHLNETGAFIWKQLENETTYNKVIEALIKEYEVTKEETPMIEKDLDEFITHMNDMQLLMND